MKVILAFILIVALVVISTDAAFHQKHLRSMIRSKIVKKKKKELAICRKEVPRLEKRINVQRALIEREFRPNNDKILALIKKVKATVKDHHGEKKPVIRLLEQLLKQVQKELAVEEKKLKVYIKDLQDEELKCDPIRKILNAGRLSVRLSFRAERRLVRNEKAVKKCEKKTKYFKKTLKYQKKLDRKQKRTIRAQGRKIVRNNKRLQKLKSKKAKLSVVNKRRKNQSNQISSQKKKTGVELSKTTRLYKKQKAAAAKAEVKSKNLVASVRSLQKTKNYLEKRTGQIKNKVNKYKPKKLQIKKAKKGKKIVPRKKRVARGSRRVCWSTGDPHYRSDYSKRGRYSFNVYGWSGDFTLVKLDDGKNFEVQTRITMYRRWSNRGLNTAVAVNCDGNRFEDYGGGRVKLNGQKFRLRRGRSKRLRGGSVIKHLGSHKWQITTAEGGQAVWHSRSLGRGRYYFNVYTYVPQSLIPHLDGLCRSRNPTSSSELRRLRHAPTSKTNLFHSKVYVPQTGIPHAVDKLKWKSQDLKVKAENYCYHKLGLTGITFKDCLYDIKVSGNMKGAQGYEDFKNDMKTLDNNGKLQRHGALGETYRYLAKVLFGLQDSLRNIEKNQLVAGLKQTKGTGDLSENLDGMRARLHNDMDRLRDVQSEIGQYLLGLKK